MFAPTISGSQGGDRLAALTIPALHTDQTPGLEPLENTTAYSVARMYDTFAADLRDGSHNAPDFAQALRTFRVIEAVENAAASGARVFLPKVI